MATVRTTGFRSRADGVYRTVRIWVLAIDLVVDLIIYAVLGTPTALLMAGVVAVALLDARLVRSSSTQRLMAIDIAVVGIGSVLAGLAVVVAVYLVAIGGMVWVLVSGRAAWILSGWLLAWVGVGLAATTLDVNRWSQGEELAVSAVTLVAGFGLVAAFAGAATRRIEELESQRARFLGTTAHELRNDLAGVSGLAEVLTEQLTDPEARELAEMIGQQAGDSLATVEDLLTSARLEADRLKVQASELDLAETVDRVLARLGSAGSIPVENAASERLTVTGDPLRVRQIIRNLVVNAQRHGGERIQIEIAAEDERARVAVLDDGPGVPVGDERRIFEPFAIGSGGRDAASVGLGLWLCRRLALMMGGDLRYRRQGGWTRFELELPMAEVGAREERPALNR